MKRQVRETEIMRMLEIDPGGHYVAMDAITEVMQRDRDNHTRYDVCVALGGSDDLIVYRSFAEIEPLRACIRDLVAEIEGEHDAGRSQALADAVFKLNAVHDWATHMRDMKSGAQPGDLRETGYLGAVADVLKILDRP